MPENPAASAVLENLVAPAVRVVLAAPEKQVVRVALAAPENQVVRAVQVASVVLESPAVQVVLAVPEKQVVPAVLAVLESPAVREALAKQVVAALLRQAQVPARAAQTRLVATSRRQAAVAVAPSLAGVGALLKPRATGVAVA